jgi:cell division septation protein DedD
MRRALHIPLTISALMLLGACALPPAETAPPSLPEEKEVQAVTDYSDEPPAPLLPDPRASLPPAPAQTRDTSLPDDSASPPKLDVPSPTPGRTESVWSVQVFAAGDRDNAYAMARRLEAEVREPVDVVMEGDGMWRVYAGRAATREAVDSLRDRLRGQGFSDAWTKQRQAETSVADHTVAPGMSMYSVQVFASQDAASAQRVADEVRGKTRMKVEVVRAGNLWKVLVGESATRAPIDAERDRLQHAGYPDCWVIYREGY